VGVGGVHKKTAMGVFHTKQKKTGECVSTTTCMHARTTHVYTGTRLALAPFETTCGGPACARVRMYVCVLVHGCCQYQTQHHSSMTLEHDALSHTYNWAAYTPVPEMNAIG
jgi:hypothetical protein